MYENKLNDVIVDEKQEIFHHMLPTKIISNINILQID